MGCVKFLDHLDAGAAVFRDLINVSAFHKAHTDLRMPKAISRAPVPVAVKLEFRTSQNPVEQFDVVAGKYRIRRKEASAILCRAGLDTSPPQSPWRA